MWIIYYLQEERRETEICSAARSISILIDRWTRSLSTPPRLVHSSSRIQSIFIDDLTNITTRLTFLSLGFNTAQRHHPRVRFLFFSHHVKAFIIANAYHPNLNYITNLNEVTRTALCGQKIHILNENFPINNYVCIERTFYSETHL